MSETFLMIGTAAALLLILSAWRSGRGRSRNGDGGNDSSGGDNGYDSAPACHSDSGFSCDSGAGDGGGD